MNNSLQIICLVNPEIAVAHAFAAKAHAGQKRKYSNLPYITHPERVAERVIGSKILRDRSDFVVMIKVALYHDILEDCPEILEEQIVETAGPETLFYIKELKNPSKGSKEPRAIRKKMDRDHLSQVSWNSKYLKLLDRIENLRDLLDELDNLDAKLFAELYISESRQLLGCLEGTDSELELELLDLIVSIEARLVDYRSN